jgi:hypothetical protein
MAQRRCSSCPGREWAGHSVAILLKVYAKCIDGQDQIAKRRIEDALRGPGEPEKGIPQASEHDGEELE